jgi:hypothetical protein
MCSPMSPAPASHGEALLAAVTEVAENSLFAFADASDQASFDAAATAPPGEGGSDWLRAWVHFSGPIAGRFELAVPEPLARHLGASFAGAETGGEISEGDLVDFTGELANMVCGTWLTRSCRHEAFSLTPPDVHRGQPEAAQAGDAASESFYLSIDDAPIRLTLCWRTARPEKRESADGQ